jgi:hypothetical protein
MEIALPYRGVKFGPKLGIWELCTQKALILAQQRGVDETEFKGV